jgi:uncharacterized DUF497 family protein
MYYICNMNIFNWNKEKNEWLRKNRNIGFEDIVFLISEGHLIEIIKNPGEKYQNQFMFVVSFKRYVYLVPFVMNENEVFLKTIIPSRKATKKYIGGRKNENK